MDSTATLCIGKLEVHSCKNCLFPNHSKLFQEKCKENIKYYYDGIEIEKEKEAYVSTLKKVSLRLEMLGYTIENCKKIYETTAMKHMNNEELSFDEYCNFLKDIDLVNFEMKYNYMTPRHYFCNSMQVPNYVTLEDQEKYPIIVEKMHKMGDDFWNEIDPYIIIRILAENPNNLEIKVSWKYYDILEGGYVNKSEIFTGLDESKKFTIITEGKSDTNIIRRSIEKLYPEIFDFFKFIDMEDEYPFTGVGELYKFVQGLNKIGIINKILVIFDNDTIGKEKFDKTKNLTLVKNISVCKLPYLEEFVEFNCLGPNGESLEDINDKAVSIECFLDFKYKQEKLPVVRWATYCENANQYQGSLIKKEEYTKNFFEGISKSDYNFEKIIILIEFIKLECQKINNETYFNNYISDIIGENSIIPIV